MATEGIPEEVRRLIAEHIVSVEQLEILLLLREHPTEVWDADRVNEQIRSSATSAARRLSDLAARGFLDSDDGSHYRYAPSARLRRMVNQLSETYAERRYTVIELIFSKPIQNLRVYSDAFRFRKEEPDDR